MMNEVDPAAPSLERVFSVSSSVDTNKNVAKGHQPGNPKREGQTLAPAKRAQSAMNETKRAKRVSRDICLKEAGIPIPPTLVPCPPFAPTKQRSEEEGHGSNYTAFQHERHPPLISQERWEVVSFAIAHQTLRSTVVRYVSAIVPQRPGSPYPFPFCRRLLDRQISSGLSARRDPRCAAALLRLIIGMRFNGHEGVASGFFYNVPRVRGSAIPRTAHAGGRPVRGTSCLPTLGSDA
jgi:hypothetical protein